jgi:periplasmic divalent cation tolerance protein
MGDAEEAVLIMVTAGGRNDAERLGEELVVEHLAASCSVVPTVHSFYFSEGHLKRDHEALLLIRTTRARSAAVKEYVREHHSYDHPEVAEVAVDVSSADYLRWLAEQVANPGSGR